MSVDVFIVEGCLSLSTSSFLVELRNIAVNRRLVPQHLFALMKRNPILLASRRIKRKDAKRQQADPDEEEDWDLEYDLLRPDNIVIADDTNAYQLFGDAVFAAPQDDLLEGRCCIPICFAEFLAQFKQNSTRNLVHDA